MPDPTPAENLKSLAGLTAVAVMRIEPDGSVTQKSWAISKEMYAFLTVQLGAKLGGQPRRSGRRQSGHLAMTIPILTHRTKDLTPGRLRCKPWWAGDRPLVDAMKREAAIKRNTIIARVESDRDDHRG